MAHDSVDPEVAALIESVNPTLDEIQKSFRSANEIMVLQYYDMLLAQPDLHAIASIMQEMSSEMKLIEEQENSINVLSPSFLLRCLKESVHIACSDFRTFQSPQMAAPDSNSDGGKKISQRAYTLYELKRDLEYVWALSLITVLQTAPDEEEHHEEIVEDFETLFDHSSELLHAIKLKSSCAMDAIIKYHMREGQATCDVLMAALLKYQPEDSVTLTEIIEYVKGINISITPRVAGLLERSFVKCMKKEDPEAVFERYIDAGLVPLSTRMFAFIFNSKTLKRKTILDYYEIMLDYGIRPEASLLRILCKQCSYMVFASMHFSLLLKKYASDSATPNIKVTTPHAHGEPSDAFGGTADESIQESFRRNERAFFAARLRDLAKEAELRNESVPLMEAMKVVHRAEAEGTTLEGDNTILATLLTFCCNGTTPLKDLVYPFNESLAYRPGKVVLTGDKSSASTGVANTEELSEQSACRRSLQGANAFNFELENNEGELLEGELVPSADSSITSSTLKNSEVHLQQMAEKNSESKDRKSGRRRPGIATSEEEAEYVLRVLLEYGAKPDNEVLKSLRFKQEGRFRRDAAVMQLAAEAAFNYGQKNHGKVESVGCFYCNFLVSECARQRNRHRLGRVLRIFVEQYYTYTEVFHVSWDFGSKHNSERNSKHIRVLLISAMRIGPLDWALGLFVLFLIHCPNSASDSVKARLYQVRTTESHRSLHGEVMDLLERCNWERNRILCCDRLMLEPHELAEANGGHNEVDTGSKKRTGASQSQEPSSYSNSHAQETHPTLFAYLQAVLREMNVSREATNFYRQVLHKQRQTLISSKRSRKL